MHIVGLIAGRGIGYGQSVGKLETVARSDTGPRRDEFVPSVRQRLEPQRFGAILEFQHDRFAGRSPKAKADPPVGKDFRAERHHVPDGRNFG